MGAAAERMQLRCTVGPSPLASQRRSSSCEGALAARLGGPLHLGPGVQTGPVGHNANGWSVPCCRRPQQQAHSSQTRRFEALRTPSAGSAASSCLLTATDPTFSSALEFKTKNPGTVKIWLDQSTKTRGKGLPSFHRHLEFAGVVHRAAGQICDMLFIRSTSVAVPSAGPPLSSPTFSAGALFPCGGGGSPWEENPSRKQDSPQFRTTLS